MTDELRTRTPEEREQLGRAVRVTFMRFMEKRFSSGEAAIGAGDLKYQRGFDQLEEWERELDQTIGECVADTVERQHGFGEFDAIADKLERDGVGSLQAQSPAMRFKACANLATHWRDECSRKNDQLDAIAGLLRNAGIEYAGSVADGVLQLVQREHASAREVSKLGDDLRRVEAIADKYVRRIGDTCEVLTRLTRAVNVDGYFVDVDNMTTAATQIAAQVTFIFNALTEVKAALMKNPRPANVSDLPSLIAQVHELFEGHERNGRLAGHYNALLGLLGAVDFEGASFEITGLQEDARTVADVREFFNAVEGESTLSLVRSLQQQRDGAEAEKSAVETSLESIFNLVGARDWHDAFDKIDALYTRMRAIIAAVSTVTVDLHNEGTIVGHVSQLASMARHVTSLLQHCPAIDRPVESVQQLCDFVGNSVRELVGVVSELERIAPTKGAPTSTGAMLRIIEGDLKDYRATQELFDGEETEDLLSLVKELKASAAFGDEMLSASLANRLCVIIRDEEGIDLVGDGSDRLLVVEGIVERVTQGLQQAKYYREGIARLREIRVGNITEACSTITLLRLNREKFECQVGDLCNALHVETFGSALNQAVALISGVNRLRSIGVNNIEEAVGAILQLREENHEHWRALQSAETELGVKRGMFLTIAGVCDSAAIAASTDVIWRVEQLALALSNSRQYARTLEQRLLHDDNLLRQEVGEVLVLACSALDLVGDRALASGERSAADYVRRVCTLLAEYVEQAQHVRRAIDSAGEPFKLPSLAVSARELAQAYSRHLAFYVECQDYAELHTSRRSVKAAIEVLVEERDAQRRVIEAHHGERKKIMQAIRYDFDARGNFGDEAADYIKGLRAEIEATHTLLEDEYEAPVDGSLQRRVAGVLADLEGELLKIARNVLTISPIGDGDRWVDIEDRSTVADRVERLVKSYEAELRLIGRILDGEHVADQLPGKPIASRVWYARNSSGTELGRYMTALNSIAAQCFKRVLSPEDAVRECLHLATRERAARKMLEETHDTLDRLNCPAGRVYDLRHRVEQMHDRARIDTEALKRDRAHWHTFVDQLAATLIVEHRDDKVLQAADVLAAVRRDCWVVTSLSGSRARQFPTEAGVNFADATPSFSTTGGEPECPTHGGRVMYVGCDWCRWTTEARVLRTIASLMSCDVSDAFDKVKNLRNEHRLWNQKFMQMHASLDLAKVNGGEAVTRVDAVVGEVLKLRGTVESHFAEIGRLNSQLNMIGEEFDRADIKPGRLVMRAQMLVAHHLAGVGDLVKVQSQVTAAHDYLDEVAPRKTSRDLTLKRRIGLLVGDLRVKGEDIAACHRDLDRAHVAPGSLTTRVYTLVNAHEDICERAAEAGRRLAEIERLSRGKTTVTVK
jgi:hypothetical protein